MLHPPPADPAAPGTAPPAGATTAPAVFAPARAALTALVTFLLIGVPADILPNPVFSREIPVRWWEYPVLAATVLLTAAWFGIRSAREARGDTPGDDDEAADRPVLVTVGVMTAWFAVACPVCNKIVLLLLGTTGALGFWAPLQPWLAGLSLVLLAGAVVYRWRARPCGDGPGTDGSCSIGSCAAGNREVSGHRVPADGPNPSASASAGGREGTAGS